MTEYDIYVQAVNKIFNYLELLKEKITDQDNLNYIEDIEKYKKDIIETAELVKQKHNVTTQDMEALGND